MDEQVSSSSSRAPPDVDTTNVDEEPVLESLDPETIESFLQEALAKQNGRVSAKLQEHDLHLRQEFREILKSNADRLTALQTLVSEQRQANSDLKRERDLLAAEQSMLPDLQRQFDSLQDKLRSLEQSQATVPEFKVDDKDLLDTLRFEVLHDCGGLPTLRTMVQAMKEKEASGGELSCHGVAFNSMHEEVLWFEHENLKVGMFANAKALCHCIQASVISQETATRALESQKKIDINTSLEAAIVTSFDGIIPPVLAGGKTEPKGGPYDCLISYQKTFEKWDPRGQGKGLKGRLSAGIRLAIRRIEVIQKDSGLQGDAMTVAVGLLNDSVRFLDELANWKTNSYQELLEDTALPKAMLWSMYMEWEAKIWEDIADVRSQYVDAARFLPGYYVWGMLKAWEVQNRYMANHFQDDPALTGIFTHQILFHGQDLSLKGAIEDLTEQVGKLDTKVHTASGEIKGVVKRVKDLETDVKRLKDKQ